MSLPLLIGLVAAVALLAWLVRRGERAVLPAAPREPADIDYDELEAAEREVRDLGTAVRPDDDVPGDDWGPGTARPPERL
jgi:hypothetical protein